MRSPRLEIQEDQNTPRQRSSKRLLSSGSVEMTGLTDAGVQDLCGALRTSSTLRSLELRNNAMTDAAVPALVRAARDSDSMLEMNLKYNDFSEDVFELMDECEKIRY